MRRFWVVAAIGLVGCGNEAITTNIYIVDSDSKAQDTGISGAETSWPEPDTGVTADTMVPVDSGGDSVTVDASSEFGADSAADTWPTGARASIAPGCPPLMGVQIYCIEQDKSVCAEYSAPKGVTLRLNDYCGGGRTGTLGCPKTEVIAGCRDIVNPGSGLFDPCVEHMNWYYPSSHQSWQQIKDMCVSGVGYTREFVPAH